MQIFPKTLLVATRGWGFNSKVERPLGYYGQQLDSVAKGLPRNVRAIAAMASLLESVELVSCSLLTTDVPRSIEPLLTLTVLNTCLLAD